MQRKRQATLSIFPEPAFVLLWLKRKTPPSKHELNDSYRSRVHAVPTRGEYQLCFSYLHSLSWNWIVAILGGRIRQKPITKEKHEIINDNVKVCWITVALLKPRWRCARALQGCWSQGNAQEKMPQMFVLLPIRLHRFPFFPSTWKAFCHFSV